jgi:hypothetical protein
MGNGMPGSDKGETAGTPAHYLPDQPGLEGFGAVEFFHEEKVDVSFLNRGENIHFTVS